MFVSGDCSPGSENDKLLCDVIGDDWRQKCNVPPCDPKTKQESKDELPYDHSTFWPRVIAEQQHWLLQQKQRYELHPEPDPHCDVVRTTSQVSAPPSDTSSLLTLNVAHNNSRPTDQSVAVNTDSA